MFETMKTEKKKVLKKLIIVFICILFIFAFINGYWYFGHALQFEDYEKSIGIMNITENRGKGQTVTQKVCEKHIDGYRIGLGGPAYLHENGSIFIEPEAGYIATLDKYGNIIEGSGSGVFVSLTYYPQYFSQYMLMVEISDDEKNIYGRFEITSDLKIPDKSKQETDPLLLKEQKILLEGNKQEVLRQKTLLEETLKIKFKKDGYVERN